MPLLGVRPITAVFVAAPVAHHRPQRAERRRRAHGRQKETAGRSTPAPARPVLKLREIRISRTKQLRRAIQLWFVCVLLGRQGPSRTARRRASENKHVAFCFPPHARIYARAARRAKSRNEAQANHKHTQRAAHSTLRSRVRRVPARASAPPQRGAREQRGTQRGEEKNTENTRGPRTTTKESGLPVASPHAACATPCAACVSRPLVLRAPRPPAVSGSGANGAGARAEQGGGQGSLGRPFPRTRTTSSEGARRSDSPRAARVAPFATWTARPRVVRMPPARGGARERRARNGATGQQRQNRAINRRAKHGPRAPRALGARILYAPCASHRASRAPCARS